MLTINTSAISRLRCALKVCRGLRRTRALARACFFLATFVLTACVHVQLNSSVSGARISLVSLQEPARVLLDQVTTTPDFAIDQLGLPGWDQLGGFEQLLWLGQGILAGPQLQDEEFYLLTASGGLDEDGNLDNQKDTVGTPVAGTWHALVTGAQIRGNQARVTTLTEATYRYLEPLLETLDEAELRQKLDAIAPRVVPDINGDDQIDYTDLLAWTQLHNPLDYRRDIDFIDDLSGAIITGVGTPLIRDLAVRVIDGVPGGFQINGSIRVAEFSKVDGDVNDRNAGFQPNSSILNPQRIDNPVILGGYLNEPGTGAAGRSFSLGDTDDYYQVDLLPGQLITLAVAEDPFANDLDLYLFDINHTLVDSSLGVSAVDTLRISDPGSYIVNVTVHRGASSYRLSIGEGDAPTSSSARLSGDFKGGELIVKLQEAQQGAHEMRKKRHFLAGGRARPGLLRIDGEDVSQDGFLPARLRSKLVGLSADTRKKYDTLIARKSLLRQADVLSVALNARVYAAAMPNDPLYNGQRWHYDMLNLPSAWDAGRGDGVIVAVLDSGILPLHPDLQGQLVTGYDFVRDTELSLDGDGIDPDPSDPGDGSQVVDSTFHGTHVAGTIAAATDNGVGVAGVAGEARIMPLRVLGRDGGGDSYDIMQAVRFAAGMPNDSGLTPPRPADVINLSLGGSDFSQAEQALFTEVAARGIIIVAAAGNDSNSQAFYPASYADVVSVSALNINREPAFYSNFHASVDIAAPGGDSSTSDIDGDGAPDLILSTAGDDSSGGLAHNYVALEGTSMAAPHVSGTVALMKSAFPQLDHDVLMGLLSQGLVSEDFGLAGRDDRYGWGLLNAFKAVGQAQIMAGESSIVTSPVLVASPRAVNFGASALNLPLELYNAGAGELEVLNIAADQPWIEVGTAMEMSSGSYIVSVQRSGLSAGLHRGAITVSSTGGDARIPVLLTVVTEGTDSSGNAGYQYVLLIDPETDEMVKQDSVRAVDGLYEFQFNNVEAGAYILVTGSDSDNDFYICDAGESCGAWPVLTGSSYAELNVTNDLEDLSFTTGFQSGVLSAAGLRRSKGFRIRKRPPP